MPGLTRVVALVACSATKLSEAAPARELYQGQLFRLARGWAEAFADSWYVLSARYHVVDPDQVLEPYDLSMRDLARRAAQGIRHPTPVDAWATTCRGQLMGHRRGPGARIKAEDRVVVLAGRAYAEPLGRWLRPWGARLETPLAGLGIGCQKQWLRRELDRSRKEAACPA